MNSTNGNELDLSGDGAAYIRVSDDQQDTLRQYEALHAFEKRYGVTIPKQHWFKDEGWARDTADRRPEFLRLMKLAETGRIKWIVVSERDRFGTTDADEFIHFRYQLRKWGCRLYDAAGTEWTRKDIATVITAVVDGEKSEQEQHSNSKRVLGSKAALARAGEWQGGLPRFGFDVVCYSQATGAELWRVVGEGLHKRRKVYPDGREERFDGKDNFPKYQTATEVLRLGPSNDRSKIDAAVSLFKRFAVESISPSGLAHYLNKLGFQTAQGNSFQGHHVKAMLEDPIYIGYYAWNRRHFGKFHRWTNEQTVLELNYDEKQSENDKADWVQSRRLFEPLVDRPTWEATQRKLDKPNRVSAPRSAALYLAGLVKCGNCGAKMIAGRITSSKTDTQPLRFEFICGGYHKAIRYKKREGCTCLRNSVFQHELEGYVNRYLEETGKRLDLLMCPAEPNGKHLTERLEGQEDDAWQAFTDGLTRLCEYLAQHHPDEYSALLEEETARRQQEQREREAIRDTGYQPSTPGTLARVVQKVFAEGGALGQDNHPTPSLPPNDFVRQCVATYRSVFDHAGIAAEVELLEAEHTALMHRYADLPTPRAKEKAKAELAALEDRIAELEGQQQNAADVIEQQWGEIRDLAQAIADAKRAMEDGAEERDLRHRAEAVRGIIHRIECTFTVTGDTGSGRKNTQLVKVTIYPIVGDARHFLVDDANSLLRATFATARDYRNTLLRLLTVTYRLA